MMCKVEDYTFSSDEDILSISKGFTRQNKEAYEVLAKQVNPHQKRVDTAKSLFRVLSEDSDMEGFRVERMSK